MTVATTIRSKPKDFAWSYSRLKNFRSCPKRHYHYEIAKDVSEPESEQLAAGNLLHQAAAKRIEFGTELPKTVTHRDVLEDWCQKVLAGHADAKAFAAASKGQGQLLVEQKLAIDVNYAPTTWFNRDAPSPPWYRGIGDVIKIVGPVALVVDWKTGKVVEDSEQLALMAACVFAHYPQVQRIRSTFVWLKEDAETRADYARADMPKLWAGLLPEVKTYQRAVENSDFPAKPGFLCRRWCSVSQCAHHGA